jgi:hypothetical protein
VARIVKTAVYYHWRKQKALREEQKSDVWFEHTVRCCDPEPTEAIVDQGTWQLLCEYYIDKWPLDVLARRHGRVSKRTIKKMLAEAEQKYKEACDGAEIR